MKHPLNTQEKIVIDRLYIKEMTPGQVARELHMSTSRVYQIKIKALAKLGAERPNSKSVAEIMDSGKNPQWAD